MAGSIAERVRVEQTARNLTREAILRQRSEGGSAAPGEIDASAVTLAFIREVLPVVAQAVNRELERGLERVRRELLKALGRALPAAPAARMAGEPKADSSDTDVDLTSAEASRQIDAAFEDDEPERTLPPPLAGAAPPAPGPAARSRESLAIEIQEALVPGIADAVSRAVDDIERGLERIESGLAALGDRIGSIERRLGSAREEPAGAA